MLLALRRRGGSDCLSVIAPQAKIFKIKLPKVVEYTFGSCGKGVAKKSKSWKKYRKLWKDFRDQKGNRGKKEVVEKLPDSQKFEKNKSWKSY